MPEFLVEPELIERRTRSRWHSVTHWVATGNNALLLMAGALVALMMFQSITFYFDRKDNRHERHKLNLVIEKQSNALADLGNRETQDQRFFNLVSQLILLSGQTTPQAQAERQQIIDQLRTLQTQRSETGATGNTGKTGSPGKNGARGQPGTSPSTTTTTTSQPQQPPPSTTTTTTTRPSGPIIPCVTVPGVKPGC